MWLSFLAVSFVGIACGLHVPEAPTTTPAPTWPLEELAVAKKKHKPSLKTEFCTKSGIFVTDYCEWLLDYRNITTNYIDSYTTLTATVTPAVLIYTTNDASTTTAEWVTVTSYIADAIQDPDVVVTKVATIDSHIPIHEQGIFKREVNSTMPDWCSDFHIYMGSASCSCNLMLHNCPVTSTVYSSTITLHDIVTTDAITVTLDIDLPAVTETGTTTLSTTWTTFEIYPTTTITTTSYEVVVYKTITVTTTAPSSDDVALPSASN